MHSQKGITLSGFLMWAIVLAFAALIGFKIGPAYFEYSTIRKQFQAIVNDAEAQSGDRRAVENAFSRRSSVEDITSISAKDIVITKGSDGVTLTAEYTRCEPMVANIRACMDFSPSSRR